MEYAISLRFRPDLIHTIAFSLYFSMFWSQLSCLITQFIRSIPVLLVFIALYYPRISSSWIHRHLLAPLDITRQSSSLYLRNRRLRRKQRIRKAGFFISGFAKASRKRLSTTEKSKKGRQSPSVKKDEQPLNEGDNKNNTHRQSTTKPAHSSKLSQLDYFSFTTAMSESLQPPIFMQHSSDLNSVPATPASRSSTPVQSQVPVVSAESILARLVRLPSPGDSGVPKSFGGKNISRFLDD
jgi:hypothetical protein